MATTESECVSTPVEPPENGQVLPDTWGIHLSSWVIQDGNYPDLVAGQTAEFPLGFWVPDGSVAEAYSTEPRVRNSADYFYDVVARCAAQSDQATLLDIGILVYGQMALISEPAFPAGVTFRIRLGLDLGPFRYGIGDSGPMVYSWRIKSILRQTAPLMEVAPRTFTRNPNRPAYEEIPRTDAWRDDGGSAEYLVRCEFLAAAPKNTSVTAINLP